MAQQQLRPLLTATLLQLEAKNTAWWPHWEPNHLQQVREAATFWCRGPSSRGEAAGTVQGRMLPEALSGEGVPQLH